MSYLYERELSEISKFHADTLKFKSGNKSRRYEWLTSRRKRRKRFDNLEGSKSVHHSPENTHGALYSHEILAWMIHLMYFRAWTSTHVYTYSHPWIQVNRIRQVHHKYRASDTLRIYLQPELGRGPNISVRATASRM